jgi:hypothetical protein
MANSRLTFVLLLRGQLLLGVAALWCPVPGHGTGGFDEEAPQTLPYFLDRLPAKPPALIFQETFNGPKEAAHPVDFKAQILALAAACESGQTAAASLTATDELLAQARLDPWRAAALCNVLNDLRDLFAATPPVTGKAAADYIRWRVEHADWFHLSWESKKPDQPAYEPEAKALARRGEMEQTLEKLANDASTGPLHVHWIYLAGACEFPRSGARWFQKVVDEYPHSPRAESARFMLARCALAASRGHGNGYDPLTPEEERAASGERTQAENLFKDYLKRYPQGRFAADVPGWLGAVAFAYGDYLRALDFYIQQADIPGHPELLKSAGFMCERCLSHLSTAGDETALRDVAAHPRLAMSLIYLVVNTPEANNYDGKYDEPAQVTRWRRALLPRLAAAVAASRRDYKGAQWEPRYLAILAEAASGAGDQAKALALCDQAGPDGAHCDDLAFTRVVALQRAHRLPEAIAAARDFAKTFPDSRLAPGAALRLALALQDNHQAGAALGELYRLKRALTPGNDQLADTGREDPNVYPSADAELSATDSVLTGNPTGAEGGELEQLSDTLLNFAPLPELAAIEPAANSGAQSGFDGAQAANLRAVLVERYLAEDENFAEARKFATSAQWSLAAEALETLTAEAAVAPAGAARAAACDHLAAAWAAARGKLLYAPLESSVDFFYYRPWLPGGGDSLDLDRRVNGLAVGLPAAAINYVLESRDEWQHAFAWWQKAADAAPDHSPQRAQALWAALRSMPSIALASPYTFTRAGETDASALSRRLYERLRSECPDSREAREFAVYYDLAPPPAKPDPNADATAEPDKNQTPPPDLSAASCYDEQFAYGEPEYRWDDTDEWGTTIIDENDEQTRAAEKKADDLTQSVLRLNVPRLTSNPAGLAEQIGHLRKLLRADNPGKYGLFLTNFLDDMADFLQEPAATLMPAAVARYLQLRIEMLSVEHWGYYPGDSGLPPVPGSTPATLNATVLTHIRAAYQEPDLAPFKDYLDFLAMAVVANEKINVPASGETMDKDGVAAAQPVTYVSRDYPKIAELAGNFLRDYPHSRKRAAARLLYARALYAASRPHLRRKSATWPECPHFGGGWIVVTDRQAPFDPRKVGAALNASDREFPHGLYAPDIRNLRGLLAWRTQDWPLALDLTLQTLADGSNPVLQEEAGRRLRNIFVTGLTDDTERAHCLAAIKARPDAAAKLRAYLPDSPYPLRAIRSWLQAQL